MGNIILKKEGHIAVCLLYTSAEEAVETLDGNNGLHAELLENKRIVPVSYTHLDVYKRQIVALPQSAAAARWKIWRLPFVLSSVSSTSCSMLLTLHSLGMACARNTSSS